MATTDRYCADRTVGIVAVLEVHPQDKQRLNGTAPERESHGQEQSFPSAHG